MVTRCHLGMSLSPGSWSNNERTGGQAYGDCDGPVSTPEGRVGRSLSGIAAIIPFLVAKDLGRVKTI